MTISFKLNGEDCCFSGDPMTPLVDFLRRERFMTGTKAVCREGFCGACIVHIDGAPLQACLRPIGLVQGRDVTTIEFASATDPEVRRLQAAFEHVDAVQCGMCFPGMAMSLSNFLREDPPADRATVKQALLGNMCRCTGYERIVDAVMHCISGGRSQGDSGV